jgi:hypothetical protein
MLKAFLSAVKAYTLTALGLEDKPDPVKRAGERVRLVWAGNYEMFRVWCRNNGFHPRDVRKVRFISSARQVRGYSRGDVIIVHAAGWWEHPDAHNIAVAISCLGP